MSRKMGFAISAIVLCTLTAAAMACPMCKDSIPNDQASTTQPIVGASGDMSGGLPGGFNTSVYILLFGFLAVLGMICFTIVKGVRNANTTRVLVSP